MSIENKIESSLSVGSLFVGALLIFFAPIIFFPAANKYQKPVFPEFLIYASTIENSSRKLLESFYEQREKLPKFGSFDLKGDLKGPVVRQVENYRLALSFIKSQYILMEFFYQLDRNITQQEKVGVKGVEKKEKVAVSLRNNLEEMNTCRIEMEKKLKELEGFENKISKEDMGIAMNQMFQDIGERLTSIDKPTRCIDQARHAAEALYGVVELHDFGAREFNELANRQTEWLRIVSAIASILIFLNGKVAVDWLRGVIGNSLSSIFK